MNESYVELLVKRKKSSMAAIGAGILGVLGVITFLLVVLTGNIFIFLISVALLGGAYFVRYNAYTEYEYLYLDKELSVDKIKNQTGRKKVASYDMTQLEILAPANSHHLEAFSNRKDIQTRDFTSDLEDSNPYEMILGDGNNLQRVRIEVNEELLTQIGRIAPRKVFKD